MSETKKIETPEAIARQAKRNAGGPLDLIDVADAVRVDREQWAAWCEQKAEEAQREAEKCVAAGYETFNAGDNVTALRIANEAHKAEAHRDTYRAVAAMLRGGR